MDKFQKSEKVYNEDYDNSSSKKLTVRIKKKYLQIFIVANIVVLLSLIFVIGHIRHSVSVEGEWIRHMDDNSEMEGMIVRIYKRNGIIKGEIISLPVSASYFEVGQIKWEDIKATGKNTFVYRDLTGGTSNTQYTYSEESTMTINDDGNKLYLDA